ncbi:XdhC family protein [Rhizobium lusitanum]|uniref:XdhC family protein n=1 Tax=Rhizobium lusitanum TaxID=293958 RepID=UPI0015721858|nr:XdhC family protein [Rhizobium lusitanum]NTJ11603.1 XdhC family protein [Rhizobium lusitanum]
MSKLRNLTAMPTPTQATAIDNPVEILRFAADLSRTGRVALATLVEIRGGAARALGSHLAIAADGRFCGYVSGGCVEAAVASEALLAMSEGQDRIVKFGEGSPFFDIALPCGGGITVAIHLLCHPDPIEEVCDLLSRRRPASLAYTPHDRTLAVVEPLARASWKDDTFVTVYRPGTRILIAGQTIEAQAVRRLATVSGYDAIVYERRDSHQDLSGLIDPYTAVALLHHDLDAEAGVLESALRSPAFYIGALGSTRTHKRRTDRLRDAGHDPALIDRIKAPIGLFGPTRDSTSLALSVLGDVAAARMVTFS